MHGAAVVLVLMGFLPWAVHGGTKCSHLPSAQFAAGSGEGIDSQCWCPGLSCLLSLGTSDGSPVGAWLDGVCRLLDFVPGDEEPQVVETIRQLP